ncbi:hypothetical protein GTQ43_35970 [Nostoc sp. KVJ3]|nr:hypothetical protein [Nostoc sp. KVJ3]
MERSVLIHFDSATGEVRVEAEGFEGLHWCQVKAEAQMSSDLAALRRCR